MDSRCFWCDVDPDEAARRHEAPHLKYCLRYREPPLPTGVRRLKVGGMTMVVMADPLLTDEVRFSCGPRPEQNIRVTGLAHNTRERS